MAVVAGEWLSRIAFTMMFSCSMPIAFPARAMDASVRMSALVTCDPSDFALKGFVNHSVSRMAGCRIFVAYSSGAVSSGAMKRQ